MSKPTIVAVPGAWHSPEIYAGAFSLLQGHGFDADVAAIRSALAELVDAGREVVLVTHSYSGFPGTEAAAGLGRAERAARGLAGGVVRLVYVMAFAMPEGFHPSATFTDPPEWMTVDAQTNLAEVPLEHAKRVFYNDLAADDAARWAAKLRPHSMGVYDSTSTHAAWRHIPSTYVVATADRSSFTPEFVDYIINGARAVEPSAFDVVETCGGGHCFMIADPQFMADVLRRAAGEKV